ncbi:MAG: sensor histidine kinase [Lewinella sp.]
MDKSITINTGTPAFPYVLRRGPWADLAFWCLYGVFWHVIFSPEIFAGPNLIISGILTFWQAAATYTHHYFLLRPRTNGLVSLPLYALGVMILIGACSALSGLTVYTFFVTSLGEESTGEFVMRFWNYWLGSILGGMTMAVALTGAIFLFGRRRDQEKREREMEHARTQTELAFLRGQLNPHFLFNALNSIYVLIPRSPHKAQEALSGFSDLLRYQLYRSEEALVPLAEELDQLQQFIDLSRLRLEEDFVFALEKPVGLKQQRIPPMLLLPLLENAVKYSPAQGGKIVGSYKAAAGRLKFTLTNRVGRAVLQTDPMASGIGLANIRRRLALLFPGDHLLETIEQPEYFTVNLEIPLA